MNRGPFEVGLKGLYVEIASTVLLEAAQCTNCGQTDLFVLVLPQLLGQSLRAQSSQLKEYTLAIQVPAAIELDGELAQCLLIADPGKLTEQADLLEMRRGLERAA